MESLVFKWHMSLTNATQTLNNMLCISVACDQFPVAK